MGGMRKPLGASALSGGATRGAAFIDRAFVLICPIDRFLGIPTLFRLLGAGGSLAARAS
jgi:hypothetical protein